MKQLFRPGICKQAFLLFLFNITNAIVWAQDSSSTSTTKTSTSTMEQTWYTEPWVWVVGGAVLILLIVALTRGNKGDSAGRTDKVTVTKTTSSELN
jgi:hypothetical protein